MSNSYQEENCQETQAMQVEKSSEEVKEKVPDCLSYFFKDYEIRGNHDNLYCFIGILFFIL
jgi:hypothetical protein